MKIVSLIEKKKKVNGLILIKFRVIIRLTWIVIYCGIGCDQRRHALAWNRCEFHITDVIATISAWKHFFVALQIAGHEVGVVQNATWFRRNATHFVRWQINVFLGFASCAFR